MLEFAQEFFHNFSSNSLTLKRSGWNILKFSWKGPVYLKKYLKGG